MDLPTDARRMNRLPLRLQMNPAVSRPEAAYPASGDEPARSWPPMAMDESSRPRLSPAASLTLSAEPFVPVPR